LPSPDLINLDCIFPYEEFPKIFKSESISESTKSSSFPITNNSCNIISFCQKQSYSELLSLKSEIKSLHNFPETYTTFYPYESETGKKCFDSVKNSSRFRNHELFMLWFPEYFFLYKNTLETILENKEGFLPLTWKIYLGIMAAATIRNNFLLKNLETEFILMGGDEDWLIFGLGAVPQKIRKLEILNNIMAHQPWKLKTQDIKDVCIFNGASAWNIEDLVQSVIVLTTFHRLATVLESMKIGVEKFEEKKLVKNEKISCVDSNSEERKTKFEESPSKKEIDIIKGGEIINEELKNYNEIDNVQNKIDEEKTKK
jgi:hypothetical protein